jgi:hypothetical protein
LFHGNSPRTRPALGLEYFCWHDLRHMSVSRHLRHEIPLHVNRLAAGEIWLFVIYAENFRDNIRGQARRLIKEVIEHGQIGTETARA